MWSDLTLFDELDLGRRIVRRGDTIMSRIRVWTPGGAFHAACPSLDVPGQLPRATDRLCQYLASVEATAVTLLRQCHHANLVVALGFKHAGNAISYQGVGFAFERVAGKTVVGEPSVVPPWSVEDAMLWVMPFAPGVVEGVGEVRDG